MTSTKAEPGPFDAMEKARDDEPVFTLLGRDPDAPDTIKAWVERRRKRLLQEGGAQDEETIRGELIQCTEAETIAWAMNNWRKGKSEEPAVMERVGYSGISLSPSDADTKAHALRALHADLCEAAFYTNNAIEKLAAMEITDAQLHTMMGKLGIPVFTLSDALEIIQEADKAIAPRRRKSHIEEQK
ncbi:MAG: hypothetical protein ACRCYS_11510 [Beijerinckiaceae bacterium]